MTVAAAIAPEPNWDRFNTPTGLRYRDRLIERAGVRTSRVWDPQAEPLWSPTPIIGYRMWRMHPDGVVEATGYRWPTPSLSAVCRPRRSNLQPGAPHRRTDSACAGLCGINAYATPQALVKAAERTPTRQRLTSGLSPIGNPLPEGVYGTVALSGRVVEHEDGYRAEHAEVTCLVLPIGPSVWTTIDADAIKRAFEDPTYPGFHGWRPIRLASTDQVPETVENQLRRTNNATRT